MHFETYQAFEKRVEGLLERDCKHEAIEILEKADKMLQGQLYKEHYFQIHFTKARLMTQCDRHPEAREWLIHLIEEGYPCPLEWKRFHYLKEYPGYEELVKKNQDLIAHGEAKIGLRYEVERPIGYRENRKYPLYINLHGDGEDMKTHKDYWSGKVFLERGYMVVHVQSSQLIFHGGYGWLMKPLQARKDIEEVYHHMIRTYPIDTQRVILGGFSGGAITSLDIVLAGSIPLRGFIALCPDEDPYVLKTSTTCHPSDNIKGVIIDGEACLPDAEQEERLSVLEAKGLDYTYCVAKGVGHWYPTNLDQILGASLDYIEGKKTSI